MNTLFSIITWPFRAMFSLILLILMPVWRSSAPFIAANFRVDAWLCRYLGPVGAVMMLMTPFVWVPLFLIFWTWVYGVVLHIPVDFLQQYTPSVYELNQLMIVDRESLHHKKNAFLYDTIGMYYMIVSMPSMILESLSDFVKFAGLRFELLFFGYVKLLGLLTIVRVLYYMMIHDRMDTTR